MGSSNRTIPDASALTGWRKSSYSGGGNGDCLEVIDGHSTVPDASALTGWRKSSHSGGSNGDCLEVIDGHSTVPVRDSKNPHGPALLIPTGGWSSFVDAVKGGQFPV
ncbi:DUF397 domain-containing protein [Streptomyces pseudoechinosporeus]